MSVVILHISDIHTGPGELRDEDMKQSVPGSEREQMLDRLAAYLRAVAMSSKLNIEMSHSLKKGRDRKYKITVATSLLTKSVNVFFENGKKLFLNLNFEQANRAADIINHRMYEMSDESLKEEDEQDCTEKEESVAVAELQLKLIRSGRLTSNTALVSSVKKRMRDQNISKLEAYQQIAEEVL